MRYLILILAIIFFSGCSFGSSYRNVTPNEYIENKYVSVNIADSSYRINKKYDTVPKLETGLPSFNKSRNGTSYKINFRTYPYKDALFYKQFFNKDAVYDDSDIVKETYDENDKEQGINYKKGWQVYVNDMRCAGGVYARVSKGLYQHVDKNYGITCGYYDKTEGRRLLDISYSYFYANGNTRLQKDKDKPREELVSQEQAEEGLKEAVKALVKTIKIKNLDKERMEKEGLMHYDKEFESTKW
ncbi:hypothetical protein HUE87_05080 [Candidatus Sulfurimonas marisnigri]|uniref:Lipoprotein n=1 Tax=Candidatus Sulfurimonas marisnigri TaxID=2740405 RepID=A0A7S7RRC9_9BACT|nr:hypothetical protein [Candidatus Sulfurimonas marisnigri]QOY55604.1 hypothetical protein HUE87_05080 [Candidatus Sulfurimonas marisnigri]